MKHIGTLLFMSGAHLPLYQSPNKLYGVSLKAFLAGLCDVEITDPRLKELSNLLMTKHKNFVYLHQEDDRQAQMMLLDLGFVWALRSISAHLNLKSNSMQGEGKSVIAYIDEMQQNIRAHFNSKHVLEQKDDKYWDYLRALEYQRTLIAAMDQRGK